MVIKNAYYDQRRTELKSWNWYYHIYNDVALLALRLATNWLYYVYKL